MIELRCSNNRLLGEFDPATLSLVKKCPTCSRVWGRPVYHRLSLGRLLGALGRGQVDGVVYADGEDGLPVDEDHEPLAVRAGT